MISGFMRTSYSSAWIQIRYVDYCFDVGASSNSVRIVFNREKDKEQEREIGKGKGRTETFVVFPRFLFGSLVPEGPNVGGKKMEESRATGNRATFAELPRLFGDSCANLFRARNPICLRLIVLLPRPLLRRLCSRSSLSLSPSLSSSAATKPVDTVEGIVPRIITTLQ